MGVGQMNRLVKFEQPTTFVNDEGGREIGYTEAFNEWAEVSKNSGGFDSANGITGERSSYTIKVHWSSRMANVNVQWMVVYDNKRLKIESITRVNEFFAFAEINASTKE
jgi:hypothetical protein